MILIGQKLRKLRESKGLTQKELGRRLCVTAASVSMYELDSRRPSYEVLIRYVDVFNISSDFILGTRNLLKDKLSRLNYEYRKSADEYIEFLLNKQQQA